MIIFRSSFANCVVAMCVALVVSGVFASSAAAQAGPYLNSDNTFVGGGVGCGAPATRNIVVSDSFIINDVNFGIIMTHPFRKDVQVTLISPNGTAAGVEIVDGPAPNDPTTDFNVLLDDDTPNGTLNADNSNHTAGSARYENTRKPDVAMTAFNGQNAQGTWQVEVCDNFTGADDGNITYTELFFNNFVPSESDLSVTLSSTDVTPDYGDAITMTVEVSNSGSSASPNGEVTYQLPSGLTYQSHSGLGTYNSTTGVWTLPNLPSGNSVLLNIVAEVQSTGFYSNQAEVTAAANSDPDSIPGNAGIDPLEDDSDFLNLAPTGNNGGGAGIPPTLSCPAGVAIFDWDRPANAWPLNAAATTTETRSYPSGGSDGTGFDFTFTGSYNRRNNNSPQTNTQETGGHVPAELSLFYSQDPVGQGEAMTLTINVGATNIGVTNLQFDIHDIDFGGGQFADELTAIGSLNGTPVSPVLTASSANQVTGSTAIGNGTSSSAQGNGNVIVTFLSPVDQVVLTYGNAVASPGNPGNQWMSVHDLTYCPRELDFGDADNTYGSPSHAIKDGVRLGGVAPDGELSAQPSLNSDGDDIAGSDDEGAVDLTGLSLGGSTSVDVDVFGNGGFLQMWIDWNGDGNFDDTIDGISEQVASDLTTTGYSGTISVPITVPATATLSQTVARLRWSTTQGLSASGLASDGEVEDYALTIIGNAVLAGVKSIDIYDPANVPLYAVPGSDVIYTITVTNTGDGPADTDSIVLIDTMPPEVAYFNGDIDTGGPDTFSGTDPVGFVQGGSGLTLTYNIDPSLSDVRFSNAATKPADLVGCNYTPLAGYDPNVTFICFNPKGTLSAGDPDPNFSISFRARIE